jgi:hypothetical protein
MLPWPRIKANASAIQIEDEYIATIFSACKNNLHVRLILSKGDKPIKSGDLQQKLSSFCITQGQTHGFPPARSDLMKPCNRLEVAGSWSIKPVSNAPPENNPLVFYSILIILKFAPNRTPLK